MDANRATRHVTLRLRLVLALLALLTVGLAGFGFATYARYARSEYQRLDEQLKSFVIPETRELERTAGIDDGDGRDGDAASGLGGGAAPAQGGPGGTPFTAPSALWGELRAADGSVLATDKPYTAEPALPDPLPTDRPFTVGSTSGDVEWRVLVTRGRNPQGSLVIVAVPTTSVADSLRQLLLTELVGAVTLLVLLGTGSWLIVRRSLRPLEHMADTARDINAGDLSLRVQPADGRGEVGQLGLALNSMLGDIEQAFRERDETEQKLRQFLADASHELRTPLTSIRGFAELFRLGTANAHVDHDVIMRRIEEESTRMKALVDDLLLLARLDQTHPVEAAPVDLAVLAADACSDAVAADRTRAVTLDAPEPVMVDGVRDHLRQAIANLVTNAVRHTPAGTPLEVTARREGDRAVVQVRDHGGGLDAEALAHVFDRFWQADKARVGKGAGLGLSIVSSIAREHGGAAEAGNADGGGAVFTLRLPLGADSSVGAAPGAGASPAQRADSPAG